MLIDNTDIDAPNLVDRITQTDERLHRSGIYFANDIPLVDKCLASLEYLSHYSLACESTYNRNSIYLNRGEGAFNPPPKLIQCLINELPSHNMAAYPSSFVNDSTFRILSTWLVRKKILSKPLSYTLDMKQKILISAGGTLQILHYIIQSCLKKGDVVIIPTPTYGACFRIFNYYQIQIELIPSSQKTGWRLTPEQLQFALHQAQKKGKVKAVFFINPTNPCGIIYCQQEIDLFAKVLKSHNLFVIDDIGYCDLEHDNEKKINQGYFNCASSHVPCITLFGPSKHFCAAGYRLGISYSNDTNIARQILFAHFAMQGSTSPLFESIAKACYSEDKTIDNYLTTNKIEYTFRKNLMTVLIKGTKRLGEMLPRYDKVISYFQQIFPEHADELLKGVDGVDIFADSEAGFYQILQFSGWVGKRIKDQVIRSGIDIYKLLYHSGVQTLPDIVFAHEESQQPFVRINFSASASGDIFDRYYERYPHPDTMAHVILCLAVQRIKRIRELLSSY